LTDSVPFGSFALKSYWLDVRAETIAVVVLRGDRADVRTDCALDRPVD
jgi:hypothetical protein